MAKTAGEGAGKAAGNGGGAQGGPFGGQRPPENAATYTAQIVCVGCASNNVRLTDEAGKGWRRAECAACGLRFKVQA